VTNLNTKINLILIVVLTTLMLVLAGCSNSIMNPNDENDTMLAFYGSNCGESGGGGQNGNGHGNGNGNGHGNNNGICPHGFETGQCPKPNCNGSGNGGGNGGGGNGNGICPFHECDDENCPYQHNNGICPHGYENNDCPHGNCSGNGNGGGGATLPYVGWGEITFFPTNFVNIGETATITIKLVNDTERGMPDVTLWNGNTMIMEWVCIEKKLNGIPEFVEYTFEIDTSVAQVIDFNIQAYVAKGTQSEFQFFNGNEGVFSFTINENAPEFFIESINRTSSFRRVAIGG